MSPEATHSNMVGFIWNICNLLRGPYKRNEYRKVILPLTILRSIQAYLKHEVLPNIPDEWIDENKPKIGYKIPLNRHFYKYIPPRELEEIEADIKKLEEEIVVGLKEVTA